MPTIVTEIVNNMFRAGKKDFVKKLKSMPVDTSTDGEESEGESLNSSVDSTSSNDISRLAASQPRDEFFLWGAELSRSRDQYVMKLDEDISEDEERHLLHLKQVCLGINAIEGERNVIEIHTTDFSDKEQRHPIASLTLGKKDCASLDLCLAWTKNKEIKFKLVVGSGPVSITGNHHVEYLALDDEEVDDPDFIAADETDDEAEISTFEDPEEIDENELKELAADCEKPVNGAPSGGDGKRKRAESPEEPSTKKRKSDSEEVKVKEVDLKA